ncbi:MAG: gamma-glutamyl-gamma-aminobutyrate hydrolase family protein [Planctomycetaceae bacterium]|jgi:putative glutamine amidotransferase|nr:gamma-glutamyl-gamma-aminobutyrate hydrolase family protein [Planctomycetaceae bacterium]
MSRKPLIGINTDYRPAQKNTPALSVVFSGYYDAILKAGALPLLIPPFPENKDLSRNLNQILDMLDGIVMIGGADLDPRHDGFMLHPSVRPMDERREMFDRVLIEKVAERRLPILAIGTGMQLLNVSQGGTLYLHIPEDLPKALPHRDAMDANHRHAMLIEKDTLVERVYGENDIRINSMHHMAVDDVAPGFIAAGRCPDGVVEVIESIRDDWFAIGTQFHPEAPTATAMDLMIFREFVQGVVSRTSHYDESEKLEAIESFSFA